jgi:hypothetical protein
MKKSILLAFLLLPIAAELGWNQSSGEEVLAKAAETSPWVNLPSGIEINSRDHKLRFPVKIVNDNGGLEFLLTIGEDKDYESLFSCSFSGQELHMALLMINVAAHGNILVAPVPESKVDIEVTMGDNTSKIEAWLSWSNGKPVEDLGLYFHGSAFGRNNGKNIYLADQRLNVIGAWPAQEMVLGPSVPVGNPYEDDSIPHLRPKAKLPFPVGTKGVMLVQLMSP